MADCFDDFLRLIDVGDVDALIKVEVVDRLLWLEKLFVLKIIKKLSMR